ncbi:pentatricopeptide repeat-containing protein [Tanacetum coccineum]
MHLSSRATDSSCQIEGTSSGVRQRSNIFFGEYETRIEHEGFMDDLLRKLSQDNGNGMTDPFHIVETKVEKYPIHDVDTHWRMRKPSEYDYDFVGDLFVDIEQLKGCLTYYALERVLIMVLQNCYGKRDDYRDPSRSYAKAILESNPGSTVKVGVTVNPDDKTYFDRFYVCFKRLKDGWKLGCRKIIALDGCFLKRPSVGEILSAIGRDANNHIFLVAWAIVNVENKDNWSWFLDLLGDDLEMPTGQGLTLMSDQHKGLIEAVKEVMPYAEHRQCARHIYEGFRKLYSGVEFRLLFWAAAKATYPGLFNKIMEKIKRANPNAYDYLLKKEPKTWSRAYFHIGTNCEAVENGFSECFNSVILSVRSKPLITMLEAIRVIVLERMHIMRNLCDKWTADICPNIQKRLEITKDQHRFWHVIPTGGNLFEVRNGSEAFGVDEERRNYSCRLWQLSGLLCCHAIAVIFKLNRMVEDYVPDCYRKQAFYDTYHQYLTLVGGMTFWPDCSDMSRVLPPKPRTMPEQASQYDVGGSSHFDVGGEEQASQYDVGGSSQFDVEGEEQVSVKRGGSAQFGVQRGRRVKTTIKRGGAGYRRGSVPSRRFCNLETHQFSATAFASTQNSQNHQVSEQEPQAIEQETHRARPRGILNFIRPSPKSKRILNKQLAKKVHGIGSTSSNALNLE